MRASRADSWMSVWFAWVISKYSHFPEEVRLILCGRHGHQFGWRHGRTSLLPGRRNQFRRDRDGAK